MMDEAELHNRFTYHPPTGDKIEKHQLIRQLCETLAQDLNELVPDGREKSLAMTQLEYVMWWANAGVARND